ncbi:glutamate racemase [Oceanirhabdus sp. W0125-5]|uniref:glutamate racemase n=1 Tax=Oceanirhabdus sp. W0125-5 TaxID=2999116 RepID=UPI0022F2F4D0|nr:glutamate racemase [Oceanirhabdus sp. W0125-5]WBW97898.1 glutamate racemase [Oceanirhabdus sp. W0125-5]
MDIKDKPIGFFDSGVGGISVLKEAVKLMPEENYIYFGDSINAPYGERDKEDVKKLTFEAVELLISKGCKGIVIACNTATSAAITDLREKYKTFPIIGIEPALKPAMEIEEMGQVIIMGTPITLRERKFKELLKKYGENKEVLLVPCAGLVDLIEEGKIDCEETEKYLIDKLHCYTTANVYAVVLGCTHYPFIENKVRNILGEKIKIIHGGEGTARQLKRQLIQLGIKRDEELEGKIEILNSKNEELIELSYELLKLK